MGNPVFSDNVIQQGAVVQASEVMTIDGSVNKSILLTLFAIIAAAFSWQFMATNAAMASAAATISAIICFVLGFVIIFKPTTSPVLAPVYAVGEGLLLGVISYMFEAQYANIVFQAVTATFACLFAMLILYKTRIIQATPMFRKVILTATFAIMAIYLVSFIGSFFHFQIPGIFGNGMVGIGFSLFVVGLASFNFIMDFDFIERGSQNLLPKYYEWYAGFGLLVTLVWLYIEMLRLLSKLQSRR